MNPFVRLWSRKRILRKGRLTGCMVLIALVMAPVVAALIFSRSMVDSMIEKFVRISDGHIQIAGSTYETIPEEYISYTEKSVSGYALMYSATETASLQIKGVESGYFEKPEIQKQIRLETADSSRTSNLNKILISSDTAEKLGVGLGDRVALMVVPDTQQGVLRPVMLQVAGIFSTGYNLIDKSLAFVDYSYALKIFESASSRVTEVVVKAEYQDKLSQVKRSVNTDGTVTDWQQKNVSVYNNYIVSMQAILLVLMIIVIVAAFFTASVANQIIEDDSREIALSKLIGASDSMVRKSAFISIFTVTLTGMAIGLCLGIVVGMNLSPLLVRLSEKNILVLEYYLVDFKATIPWAEIGLVMLSMAVVSAIAVLVSLRHTRKITPIRLFTGI